jgi:hypothetical protein
VTKREFHFTDAELGVVRHGLRCLCENEAEAGTPEQADHYAFLERRVKNIMFLSKDDAARLLGELERNTAPDPQDITVMRKLREGV